MLSFTADAERVVLGFTAIFPATPTFAAIETPLPKDDPFLTCTSLLPPPGDPPAPPHVPPSVTIGGVMLEIVAQSPRVEKPEAATPGRLLMLNPPCTVTRPVKM